MACSMSSENQYSVRFQEFHVDATGPEEAADQAIQTFLNYPSSRRCEVREWGTEDSIIIEGGELCL